MQSSFAARTGWWALISALCLGACREADDGDLSGAVDLLPSTAGAHGCTGPDQVFSGACSPACVAVVPLAMLVLAPESQIVASALSETLYATGANGQVVALDATNPALVETELAAPGAIDAFLTQIGAATPAVLSGIAVLPSFDLVLVEHTNNVLLALDLAQPGDVRLFAGEPFPGGGFADGGALVAPQARFDFDRPVQLAATDDPGAIVFVPDPGNHALRAVRNGIVETVAGTGAPFHADGDESEAAFDTPVAVTVSCSGTALVAETGAGGLGGNRVRRVMFASSDFEDSLPVEVDTVAGNGAPATVQGEGTAASLAEPMALFSTSGEDVYWIDSGTGILRRLSGSDDAVDCPLFSDCAAAVTAGGTFPAGGQLALTQTALGRFFVVAYDPIGMASTLFELTP